MLRNRLIAGMLSAVICTSAVLPNQALYNDAGRQANAATQNEKAVSGDYDIKSNNSLGNFFQSAAAEKDLPNPYEPETEISESKITALDFDYETGLVQTLSTQSSEVKIVISFIDEETSENAFSVETSVEAGESIKSEIKVDTVNLPQFFILKAQLFDQLNRPIGNEYTNRKFTKAIQEVIAADINDFDPEYVVNFDEDETNNFLVLDEETVMAESSDEKNNLVSADYENNVFVFDNADETISSLKEGEYLYIQPDEENFIAVNVENVEIDGDTVTVQGNDDIEDMFDFIKIDNFGTTSDLEFDPSVADEGVTFPNTDEDGNIVVDENDEVQANYEYEEEFNKYEGLGVDKTLRTEIGPINLADLIAQAGGQKITKMFNANLSVAGEFNFYFFKKHKDFDIGLNISFQLSLTLQIGKTGKPFSTIVGSEDFSETIKKNISLFIVNVPTGVAGVIFEFEPSFFVEASGNLNVKFVTQSYLKLSANKDGIQEPEYKLFESKNVSAEFLGIIYTGIELAPKLKVFSKKVAYAELSIRLGIEFSLKMDLTEFVQRALREDDREEKVSIIDSNEDHIHGCKICANGNIKFRGEVAVKLHALKYEFTLAKITIRIGLKHDDDAPDFHFSPNEPHGFALGPCNYFKYKTEVLVKDQNGNPISGAEVKLDDKTSVTGGDGKVRFYCASDRYTATATYLGKSNSKTINVDNRSGVYPIVFNITVDKDNNTKVSGGGNEPDSKGTTVTTVTETLPREAMTGTVPTKVVADGYENVESGSLGDYIGYMLYKNGQLSIFGHGDMYDFNSSPFRDPSLVKNVYIENDGDENDGGLITSIGNNVFVNCSNMESMNMPQSIKRIGKNAFKNCSSLPKITYVDYFAEDEDYENELKNAKQIPDGKLIMPKAITAIEDYAFCNCTLFNDIVIPKTVTDIGSYAFSGTSITEIEIPDTVKKIGDYVFSDCTLLKTAVIKNCEEGMGIHIFSGCASIEDITLPYMGHSLAATNEDGSTQQFADFFLNGDEEKYNAIDNYGGWKRYIPKSLKSVTITGGTRIPNYAFYRIGSVKNISVPKTIKSFGNYAFADCVSLENGYIPEGVVSIGKYAFSNCGNAAFKTVSFPTTLTSIGDYAFSGCTGLTGITVPKNVTKIGAYAFNECSAIKSAVIAGGADGIGLHIFSGCKSLAELTLPFAGFDAKSADDPSVKSEIADYFLNGNDKEYYAMDNSGGWKRYIPNALKKITITGGKRISNYAFYRLSGVDSIVIPKSITEIGNYAFADCTSIINGYIPEGITSIGKYAFSNCGNADFKKVAFPTTLKSIGDYAFSGCVGLTSITVPKNVKTIGEYAFNNCSAITDAVIYGGADGIGLHIFSGCKSLAELTLPFAGFDAKSTDDPKVTSQISDYFLNGDEKEFYAIDNSGGWKRYIPNVLKKITILDGTRISNYAFYRLSGVETIVIPETITEIGNYAFAECTSFKNAFIPEGITSIGNYAFSNCGKAAFGDIEFPTTLKSIGKYAFNNCKGLGDIVIPDSVNTIGEYAFNECSSIGKAVIDGGAGGIGLHIFSGCKSIAELSLPFAGLDPKSADDPDVTSQISDYFLNGDNKDYYAIDNSGGWKRYIPIALKKITIKEGKRISNFAFYRLSGVESITIPKTVTEIGNYAFAECTSLTEGYIPEGVTSIGKYSFNNCSSASFKDVKFPTTLKSIGEYAFSGCIGLTSITVPETVKTIGTYAFNDCSSLKTAVIYGGEDGIGLHIFSGCKLMAELTLPFAGFSLADVNAESSTGQISDYFLNGDTTDYYGIDNSGGWKRYIPRTLKKITILGGKKIPSYAFLRLNGVKEINIPDDISYIGKYAFAECSDLKSAPLTNVLTEIGDYAFSGCSAADFKSVSFPKTLISIGGHAFTDCDGLTDITVPENVQKIGEYAFIKCDNLVKADIYGGANSIGLHIFSECGAIESLTIPYAGLSLKDVDAAGSTQQVSDYFLDGNEKDYYVISNHGGWTRCIPKSLKTVTVLGGKRIPNYAFFHMNGLENINVPDDITTIGVSAFEGCTSLKNSVIKDTLTSIGDRAFVNCSSAEFNDVKFSDSVESIGKNAFSNCDGLSSIVIPESVNSIGEYAFENCNSLKSADIAGDGKVIGLHIFNECNSIESLSLPFAGFDIASVNEDGSTQQLSDYFLNGNKEEYFEISNSGGWTRYIPKSLTTITVDGGKRIPKYAFYRMIGVEDVYLPKNITNIADNAFNGCDGIENVYYPSTREDWEKNVTIGVNNEAIDGKVRFLGVDYTTTTTTTTTGTSTTTTTTTKPVSSSTSSNTTSSTSKTTTSAVTTSKNSTTTSKTTTLTSTTSKTTTSTTNTTTTSTSTTSKTTTSTTSTTTTSTSTTSKNSTTTSKTTTSASTTSKNSTTTSKTTTSTSTTSKTTTSTTSTTTTSTSTTSKTTTSTTSKTTTSTSTTSKTTTTTTSTTTTSTSTTSKTTTTTTSTTATSTSTTSKTTTTTSTTTTSTSTTSKTTTTTTSTTTTSTTTTTETTSTTSETTTETTTSTTSETSETTTETTSSTTSETSETTTTTTTSTSTSTTTTTSTTSTSTTSTSTSTSTSTTTETTTTPSTTTSTPVDDGPDIALGDASGDGKVDAVDASIILMIYAMNSTSQNVPLTEKQKAAYDVNGDGKIDALDASYILCYYVYVSIAKGDVISLKEFIFGV